MDWISFFLGVGAIVFINIAYTIWVYPKQYNEITELQKRNTSHINELESLLNSTISDHDEKMEESDKQFNKVRSAFEKLKASTKLRKVCPACGIEFPLYLKEEP